MSGAGETSQAQTGLIGDRATAMLILLYVAADCCFQKLPVS